MFLVKNNVKSLPKKKNSYHQKFPTVIDRQEKQRQAWLQSGAFD
jgi:hypothetical protein